MVEWIHVRMGNGGILGSDADYFWTRRIVVKLSELTLNDRLAIASLMHCLKTGMTQDEFDKLPEDEKLMILDERESGCLFVCGRKDIEEF